jgi:hypothetical protein
MRGRHPKNVDVLEVLKKGFTESTHYDVLFASAVRLSHRDGRKGPGKPVNTIADLGIRRRSGQGECL